MARISKDEHPRILRMVDSEHRKVADIATEYGCSPANIYALLGKLRRTVAPDVAPTAEAVSPRKDPPEVPVSVSVAAGAPDLFAPDRAATPEPVPAAVTRVPVRSVVTPLPAPRSAAKKGAAGLGATLAKPGVALMMRTADGEENLTPFRSLDDLLSAVKPILRAAARSPDAVWFCIQPVDLASLDSDAA